MEEIRKAMDDLLFKNEAAPNDPATYNDLADKIYFVIHIAQSLEPRQKREEC